MSDPSYDDATSSFSPHELRARLKQITQPLVDSLDSRLSAQVDKRVDQRVDETMKDRLSVIERALADLDRTVHELQDQLDHAKKGKEKD